MSVTPGQDVQRARAIRWSDLRSVDNWAKPAINYVAASHDWMRDFPKNADGSVPFRPGMVETRKYLARAMVKAFAPDEAVDPSITFTDIDATEMFYRYANVAVKKGWLRRTGQGAFLPDTPVRMTTVHRVIVLALGLGDVAQQLDALHAKNGVTFDTPLHFGTTMLGMHLGLRYNNSDDARDVLPLMKMARPQVAYSIYKAKTLESWVVPNLRADYGGIVLPALGPVRAPIVKWGVKYVGFPYVYGGEWGLPSGQPVPGFDCSGLAWWLLRADEGSWNVNPPRPYVGWSLPQRSSADMASVGKLTYKQLIPGDLMFYDGNGDRRVDHVDVYLGNGYALDSSGSVGGVTIMWVGAGSWYREHFVHGRRTLPTPAGLR